MLPTQYVLATPNSGKTDKKNGGNTAKKYLHSNALRESGRNEDFWTSVRGCVHTWAKFRTTSQTLPNSKNILIESILYSEPKCWLNHEPVLNLIFLNVNPWSMARIKNIFSALVYIYILCLSVPLYPINVKTAEPIGPKLFVEHHVTPKKVYKDDRIF